MVKPITKETLFMNVMELDFPSKIELEHWLETFQDRIWTDDLMAELSKAGLIRVTVSQVWNKENNSDMLLIVDGIYFQHENDHVGQC